MRSEPVRGGEGPGDASRPPAGAKGAPPGPSFAACLAPEGGAPPQAPPCAPPAVDPLVGGLALAGAPNALAARAARAAGVPGSAPGRGARPDPLDPATRHAAQIAPLLGANESARAQAPLDAPAQARARASLEDVLPALVRRIAWSGDGKRGTLRLEFGEGGLAGGTLLVHADDGRVRVELHAPAGTDTSAWKRRIASRLSERGVALDEVIVD